MTRGLHAHSNCKRMQTQPGFIAALDQSGGSTPNAASVRHSGRCGGQ